MAPQAGVGGGGRVESMVRRGRDGEGEVEVSADISGGLGVEAGEVVLILREVQRRAVRQELDVERRPRAAPGARRPGIGQSRSRISSLLRGGGGLGGEASSSSSASSSASSSSAASSLA